MKAAIRCFTLISILLCLSITSSSQVNVIGSIEYEQVSHFETDYVITAMKMSGDGLKIVFATGGPAVKVYTINSDGTGLTQIYDFERTGTGPSVDISAGGEKVIWCDGEGEVFIANLDGSEILELATLLPNPDPNFGDIEPIIPLPPRITSDGSQVLFIHMDRDPMASGVWQVDADDSGLTQIFNYTEMAEDLFGPDTAVYNRNTAFSDGFDISADGSRMIFGTKIFKLAAGDPDRGDAIAVDGTDFYNVIDYAIGNQPFATYVDGDFFTVFRRVYNPELDYDEINVYVVPLGTGSPVKVISGLDIFGTSSMTQMASDGFQAIVHGANGRLPITLVDGGPGPSRLDLVSIDGLSIAMGGYRFSESWLPSISWDGSRFCFLSTSIPPQIWVADINSDGINSQPAITEIQFDPDEVAIDGSTTATISGHVTDMEDTIHTVTFDAYKDGVFKFRALESDWPYSGMLLDDGTFGDEYAGDGYFTNNSVRPFLAETPLGSYTIRIAAANATLDEVTMVDAEPFFIVEPSASTTERIESPGFNLHQNFPNPFRHSSRILYEIPVESQVEIRLLDLLGKEFAVMVNGKMEPGQYSIDLHAKELPAGLYFYTMRAGAYYMIKRMQVLN
ncbi:MAG: T9SS type A sorting domain-containing protein [Bacteroidetes bacterium]|nr:T9SS type A sorting domain-containing protein [Bacteroidota bacterium]